MAGAAKQRAGGRSAKVTTPRFRVSFPYVFDKQPPMEGSTGEPKYSVVMLFDGDAQKSDAFKQLRAIAHDAARAKFSDKLVPDGQGWYRGLKNPLRDGAEKEQWDGYGAGVVFATASSKMQPGLVDARLNRIIEKAEFYAGCYARATVTAYAYDKAGNKGVAFGVQNIQKLADGEHFDGRMAAEEEFDPAEEAAFGEDQAAGGDASFLE